MVEVGTVGLLRRAKAVFRDEDFDEEVDPARERGTDSPMRLDLSPNGPSERA